MLSVSHARLLVWYPFDDGAGATINDASGNHNNLAKRNNGFSWNQKSGAPFGGSVYFNGTGAAVAQKREVEIEPATINFLRGINSSKITIAFWANPDQQAQGSPPFGFSRSDLTRIAQIHQLQGDSCYFDISPPGGGSSYFRAGGPTTAPVNTWTHWAFVYDGTLGSQSMKIYRNGTLFSSSNNGAGSIMDWSQIAIFDLGSSQRYAELWRGALDDFAIWDEALTQAEVSTMISDGVRALAAPLVDSFKATPGNVSSGAAVTLTWATRLATGVTITPGVGTVNTSGGSVVVNPTATTTYRLTATNGEADTIRDLVVGVNETAQPLTISEFLADNESGLRDDDGDRSDWIEIYNPNAFAVSMAGWKLADSEMTWVFPDVQLEGKQYLLVFASDKNRRDPARPLHTNFKLSADGEFLALYKPDGSAAATFSPAFPAQRPDISFGPNESGGSRFFVPPTPGEENKTSVDGFVANPSFNIGHGFYSIAQSIVLTCATPGATIRYTTDNSIPSETTGTVYTSPVAINKTTILRARAFKTNSLPSQTITQTYLYLSDVLAQGNATPSGWPANGSATLNGQVMRYGFNSTLKAQYSQDQLLSALRQIPSISIVTDQANLTGQANGIYSNAMQEGIDWERPASVEYFSANDPASFQIDGGLRIRGGYSRNSSFPKHGFRVFFRNTYGTNRLVFPLHGISGTSEFESIDLRTEQNYNWSTDGGTENTAVREVFTRDLQAAIGHPTTRSRSVHLYVNGQYWGLYMTEERAQQDYAATYFGGSDDDYDVVQTSGSPSYTYEVSNGTVDAWQQTWTLARACATNPTNENYFKLLGCDATGMRNPALPIYIDPDNLAETMLLYYYTGDGDAPLSTFLDNGGKANNWRGVRNRNGQQPWRFFLHDGEHSVMAPSWVQDRVNRFASSNANRTNFLFSNPEWISEDLALNPEYRLKIADAAQRLFFNEGALTSSKAIALFNARAAEINPAIMADAARWGTSAANHTFNQWTARLNNIRSNFFPSRSATVVAQLRTRGYYPNVSPPTFSTRGGRVSPGLQLTLGNNAQAGTIYYTTDGSDPRAVGGSPRGQTYAGPVTIATPMTVRARFLSSGGVWSALDAATYVFAPAATSSNLVVSKLDYHPTDPTNAEIAAGFEGTDFEYIELMNISSDDVSLRDVEFRTGITFPFLNSPIQTLAPGARVLIVGNKAGFESRHGAGLPIAGEFGGNLSNSGESIQAFGAGGAVVVDFTYRDITGWPQSPDGDGYALVVKNPYEKPNLNAPESWRASRKPGGAPGTADWTISQAWKAGYFSSADLANPAKEATVWGDSADPDGDGIPNLLEEALNGNPNSALSAPKPIDSVEGENLVITYTRKKDALEDLSFTPESVGTLDGIWNGDGMTEEILSDNGTFQTVKAKAPMDAKRGFLRLKVTRRP